MTAQSKEIIILDYKFSHFGTRMFQTCLPSCETGETRTKMFRQRFTGLAPGFWGTQRLRQSLRGKRFLLQIPDTQKEMKCEKDLF